MTISDDGITPFLLMYAEPLPEREGLREPNDVHPAETRFTRAQRETTDDE
jgi:hypothetical protein